MSMPILVALLFFLVGFFMLMPSPVTLLFFLKGLLMPVSFPMGLCVCTFSSYSVLFSCRYICTYAFFGRSVYLYLL